MDRNTWIKIKVYFMLNARKRTRYLIKKRVFREVGSHFVFFPRKIPQDPQMIKFHNNVVVATDVMFINHDIMHEMFNGKSADHPELYYKYWNGIEIKGNVFIGARSIILPGVILGPDVVVAAGSVVTKNFSGGCIIGGNPAKVIGCMNDLMTARRLESKQREKEHSKDLEAERIWQNWSIEVDVQETGISNQT